MGATATPPVTTVESLQAELVAEREAHQLTKDSLDAEQSAHESTKAEAEAAAQEATDFIAGQAQTIAEQEARIIALQTSPSEHPVFEYGDVQYEVTAKSFKYKGVEYTAAQLLGDSDLQKEMLDKKMGFIVKKEA